MRQIARVALVSLSLGAAGCRGCASSPSVTSTTLDTANVGPLGAVDDVDFAPYLALAHAIVTRGARPEAHPPSHAGQRVFVTFWSPGHEPVRTTGLGATLLDSVTIASEAAAKDTSGDGRVEIDVLTSAVPAGVSDEMRESIYAIGTEGWMASDAQKNVGFVLPSEILAEKLVHYDKAEDKTLKLAGDKIRARIAERARVSPSLVDAMSVARFGVKEVVEGPKPGDAPIALHRSRTPLPTALSADELVASVRAAAEYLTRMVDENGHFVYMYDPQIDGPPRAKEYGLLRHAGAIYAMMEAYDEMRVVDWVTAAERAIGYLVAHTTTTPDGAFVRDNNDEEQQKVGGGGLALVALTKYQQATGDARYLETMRSLARFIVHQQYADGHFRDNADVMREDESMSGKKLKKEVFYFVGEAMLGLVRLYAIDPNPQWLASARKAADWVVEVRDAHEDLKHQIHDHWMSYALHDLYVFTGDAKYADHAMKIAHAIEVGEMSPPPAPDYAGSYYDQGETTPVSTRVEALASDIQLARYRGDAADEAWLQKLAMRLACMTRSAQLDAESDYMVKNPARAIGGVRESLLNGDVRIDYDQHAASAWLRLAHELRDPKWGAKQ